MSGSPQRPSPIPEPDGEAALNLELRRWLALHESDVLDTPPEPVYDALTTLAAEICGMPISLMSLVDVERQWFKSRVGLDVQETARALAFCHHAIKTPGEMMEIADARQDSRFAANPLVTDAPNIRFYAGAPILSDEGLALGTLCVIDRKPGHLSESQRRSLAALAKLASELLSKRRRLKAMQLDSVRYQALFEQPLMGVLMCTLDGEIAEVNARYCQMTGRLSAQLVGTTLWKHSLADDQATQHAEFMRQLALKRPFRMEYRVLRPDGSQGLLGSELSVLNDSRGRPMAMMVVVEDLARSSLLDAHRLANAERFTRLNPAIR